MKLSRQELNQRLKGLAQQERELLHEILETIREIERRRSYLQDGYPSLYDYLTKYVGYSEGAAQRRIDAARLLSQIPDLGSKIREGTLTLNQISLVQKASRRAALIKGSKGNQVSSEQKQDALVLIQGKSHFESEGILAKLFELPKISSTKLTRQSDQSVRLEMTLSPENFIKLETLRIQLSHSVSSGDWGDLFIFLAEQALKQRPPKAEGELCGYIDPQSGKKCGSSWQLQKDHIHPRWAGGSNSPSNLQILCGVHNRLRYQNQTGTKYI